MTERNFVSRQFPGGGRLFPAGGRSFSGFTPPPPPPPPGDNTPPVISNIVETITDNAVAVAWTTNEPADGQLEWGATTGYGNFTPLNTNRVTDHHESISGLTYTTPSFAHVQSKGRLIGGSGASSNVLTLDANPTVGNLAVVGIGINTTTTTITSITDNAPGGTNTYTLAKGPHTQSLRKVWQYECVVANPGATQITVVFSAVGANVVMYDEFSGVKPTSLLGVSSEGGNDSVAGGSVAAMTPVLGSLIVASVFGNSVPVAGSGYTLGANDSTVSGQTYRLSSTASETAPVTVGAPWSEVAVEYLVRPPFGQAIHYRILTRDAAGNLATGSDRTATVGPPADTTPPVISSIAAGTPSLNSVTITWTTNEAATSRVQYRVVGSPTWTLNTLDTGLVTSHSMNLTGLVSGSNYEYEVISADGSNNSATSSPVSTFTTAAGTGGLTQMILTDVSGGVLSSARINPLYNAIAIEVRYTGDDDFNSACALEFKKTADSVWRTGLPLWRTVNGTDRAHTGSVLNGVLADGSDDVLPNTSYDLRLTVTDGAETTTVTATVSTLADPHKGETPPSTPTYTHYVDGTLGNDSNNGTSSGTPWQTLTKMINVINATNADMTIRVKAGYYAPPSVGISNPNNKNIWIVGDVLPVQYNAGTGEMDRINGGSQVVIEGFVVGPTGAVDVSPVAGWAAVTPDGDATHVVYSRALPSATYNGLQKLGYAATHADTPQHIPRWASQATWTTAAGWAHAIYVNTTQNWGFWLDTSVSPNVVYLRLPPWVNQNPNTLYMSGGVAGISLGAQNVRITGLVVRNASNGLVFETATDTCVVDHSIFENCYNGFFLAGGQPGTYGKHLLTQYNRFIDTNHLSSDVVNEPPISWSFIKSGVSLDGTFQGGRTGADSSETTGIFLRGGLQHCVTRFNTFDGYFNGITCYGVSFDRYAATNWDIHDNVFTRISDDALEPEQSVANWRAWRNRVLGSFDFFSAGPVDFGPLYVYRNSVSGAGTQNMLFSGFPVAFGFKYSNGANPPSRLWVVHNTIWSDQQVAQGGDSAAGGSGGGERFWLRNNIFRSTRYAFSAPGVLVRWDEDYNYFATSDPTRGINYGSNRTTVAAYRAASGQGVHTNNGLPGGGLGDTTFRTMPDDQLGEPVDRGQLTLLPDSVFVAAGTPVPNISDLATQYLGAAPSLGYQEIAWTIPRALGTGSTTLPAGTWLLASPVTIPTPTHPLLMVVTTEQAVSTHITGMTQNGVALARYGSPISGNGLTTSIWWLAAPTTGELDVTVDATVTLEHARYVAVGAKQTTPFTAVVSNSSSSYSPSVNVNCESIRGVAVIDVISFADNQLAGDIPSGARYHQAGGSNNGQTSLHSEALATSDPQAMGWSLAGGHASGAHLLVAFGVKPYGS